MMFLRATAALPLMTQMTLSLTLALAASSPTPPAALGLPSVLTDNAVLPARPQVATVWGWAATPATAAGRKSLATNCAVTARRVWRPAWYTAT